MENRPRPKERTMSEATVIGAMYQNEDTGMTMFVDQQQIDWGFDKANPRLYKMYDVYDQKELVKECDDLKDEIERLSEDLIAKGTLMQEMYKMASRGDCNAVCDEYISAGEVILWNHGEAKAEGEKSD
jgi:hypothetical protein